MTQMRYVQEMATGRCGTSALQRQNQQPHAHCCCCCLPQVHYIMDEMLLCGCVVDTNKSNILEPIALLDSAAAAQ